MNDITLDLHIAFFAAREDVYVVNAAEVRRERLTSDVLRHAIDHHYAISGYMADDMGMTHVGAIDIDRHDGESIARRVQSVVPELSALGVRSRRGAHLWVGCSDARVPLGTMRRALQAALHRVDPAFVTDTSVEVFPKVGSGELAVGALRLPGMPHQKTQITYPGFTLHTEVGPEPEQFLRHRQPVSRVVLEALSQSLSQPTPYPRPTEFYRRWTNHARSSRTQPASHTLREWGIVNARPGATVPCPMHDDRHRSLTIFRDDERVYCGSPACVLHGEGHGVGSIALADMGGHNASITPR